MGEAWAADGVSVGYLPQEPVLDETKDVDRQCHGGRRREEGEARPLQRACHELFRRDGGGDGAAPRRDRRAKGLWDLDAQVEQAMDALRCPPGDAEVKTLSGGERRRVALCKLLLAKPDILLLDEPTNHLDAESVAWLEHHLRDYAGTVIMVTHDRYFLDNITEWTLELDRGAGIPYKGSYSSWLEQKQKRLDVEGKQDEARQRTLARELDWIRASPKARQAKSKARIRAYEEMLAEIGARQRRQGADHHSARAPARRCRDRGRAVEQGLRRHAPDRRSLLQAAARRHCRGDRAERRRQDDAVPHDRRPGQARRRRDPRRARR